MTPPNRIRFNSDHNELVFESEQKPTTQNKLKERSYTYRYTLSNSKYNTTLTVTQSQVEAWFRRAMITTF